MHVSIDDAATDQLEKDWIAQNITVPLNILESPYRDISAPLAKYIRFRREQHGSEVITVYTPHYIVGHWWENLLHNHTARRIRHKLALTHGVVIALVPWLLDSSTLIYGRRSRPLPGQDRRGELRRPVARKPMPPAAAVVRPKSPAAKGGLSKAAAKPTSKTATAVKKPPKSPKEQE